MQRVTMVIEFDGTTGKFSTIFDPEIPNLENLEAFELSSEQAACLAAVMAAKKALQG